MMPRWQPPVPRANQAVAAARAGARVRLVGAVGDDDVGRAAIRELTDEGIDVSAVARLGGTATGVALIVVDQDGENQIAVASGANDLLDAGWVRTQLEASPMTAATVVLLDLEVPDPPLSAAADAAVAAGAPLIVNPAPARALATGIVAARPILTPNQREATTLTGEAEPGPAARALARMTGAPVVVTLGAEGALVLDGGSERRVPAVSVRAVDTTGAGDTFSGVLAAALADGLSLDDAVDRAMAAAALSVTVPGARTGIPTRAQIESLVVTVGSEAAEP